MNNGKYNPKLLQEIVTHIRKGVTARDSAALVGISEDRYYVWLKQKKEFKEAIQKAE